MDTPLWRSLLYVPANVERFVERAHTRGADGIILDLEDSVPPAEKAAARAGLERAAVLAGQAGADVLVRINRPLELAVPDIEAAVSPAVAALMLTKLDGPGHVRLLAEVVERVEAARGLPPGHTRFVAMIETSGAFLKMDRIASAHPRVVALDIGGEDLALSLDMAPVPETLEYPKQRAVIAARAAGIIPLGIMGTVADYSDLDAVRRNALRARQFGMEGATCVHPSNVPILNEAFSPSPEEVAQARRIVDAYEEATAAGRGAVQVDGRMIDVPVFLRARRTIDRDAAVRARSAS